MEKGYLAMILHAHLPFVRHPDRDDYLEENWYFEALTETYIPLIKVFQGLVNDGIDFRITISVSPPLGSMFNDKLLQERYLKRLNNLIELAQLEVERTQGDYQYNPLAEYYLAHFKDIRKIFVEEYQMNLIGAFKKFWDLGKIELITCGATHGFLPLMETWEAKRAQIAIAVDSHESFFGRKPRGLWLPECAYSPGIGELLKEYGIEFFITDTHGVLHSNPRPKYGVFGPVLSPEGVAAFGRDIETSKQVWDMHQGYPGDYYYREFYRDIGYDLEMDYIAKYIHPEGIRIDTGIKYYRITEKGGQKEPYIPHIAAERAAEHAGNFMFNRERQIQHLSANMDRKPIVIAPYDAELFGHWWYEGPLWINYLFRKIYYDQNTIKLITPIEYLDLYSDNQKVELPMSSWGHKGYNEVWLENSNDWIYRHLHKAEEKMVELANLYPNAKGLEKRALNQAARELLLAQSSDWAFIMKTGTTVDYAVRRTKDHIGRFNQIYDDIRNNNIVENWLEQIEEIDNIFPDIDYEIYMTKEKGKVIQFNSLQKKDKGKRIMMLSWEFPPKTIGGLARHVDDLSKALADLGEEVHVLTSDVPGCPPYEVVNGVHVHRIKTYNTPDLDFFDWIIQLNMNMSEYGIKLYDMLGSFDIIHAHDWLVAYAAKALKDQTKVPLVATIHATEHGRNQGLHNDTNRYIHSVEWWLTYEAWRVICCSDYMAREIKEIFDLPTDKLEIIPNGVNPENLDVEEASGEFRSKYALPHEKIVFFVGRLVREKGIQVLLQGAPQILSAYHDVKFVIAGKGPMEANLKQLAKELGIEHKVCFTGFITDEDRNKLLKIADIAIFPSLYEPFGIVALEAMAAKVPVIVSDTGGLAEIIEHGVDGMKIYPDDVNSLTYNLLEVLRNNEFADNLKEKAWDKINSSYLWPSIAKQTHQVYEKVLNSISDSDEIVEDVKDILESTQIKVIN